jgi:hypothetical protein
LPLLQRVAKLEKDNRNLKRIISIMCLSFVAFITTAQVKSPPKVIEAERFVLRDSAGKELAYLGTGDSGPELKITDVNPKRAAFTSITAGLMHMYYTTGNDKDSSTIMGPAGVTFMTTDKTEQQTAAMYSSGPTIELKDKQGFQTTVGATDLETVKTGESHKTSAASIVIFDKEKNVIWKAPVR